MTIELAAETQRLLEQRMSTGRYATPDEAIRAALIALNELQWNAIDRAEGQIEEGIA